MEEKRCKSVTVNKMEQGQGWQQFGRLKVINSLDFLFSQLGTDVGRRRIHQDCQKQGQQMRSCDCCKLPIGLTK